MVHVNTSDSVMGELHFYLFFEEVVYSNIVLDVIEVEKLTSYSVDLYVF